MIPPYVRRNAPHLSIVAVVAAACLVGCGAPSRQDELTVRRVIDGDTVQLRDGRMVRYLGIDTPEVRRREGNRWVVDPEPMSREATALNRALVQGRAVRLEYDAQTHDRFDRLLAYVYVFDTGGGEIMVNAALLREGLAEVLIIPPNGKYADEFRALAEEARRARRGLWGTHYED